VQFGVGELSGGPLSFGEILTVTVAAIVAFVVMASSRNVCLSAPAPLKGAEAHVTGGHK
jgi:hypothetical protein